MNSLRHEQSEFDAASQHPGGAAPDHHGQAGGAPETGASVALSWSGGKDSALALWALREEHGVEPVALLTTVAAGEGRVTMHEVRGELIRAQAEAAGLALVEVELPDPCPNDAYEARMALALATPPLADAAAMAFADLHLEDIRRYRERRLEGAGREALFPLWGRDPEALARRFIAAGFEATLVCVDSRQLDPSFCGRRFDAELLAELPPGVDPCGENGEFHTFVHGGPVFREPIEVERGELRLRNGFAYLDLLPGSEHPPERRLLP